MIHEMRWPRVARRGASDGIFSLNKKAMTQKGSHRFFMFIWQQAGHPISLLFRQVATKYPSASAYLIGRSCFISSL